MFVKPSLLQDLGMSHTLLFYDQYHLLHRTYSGIINTHKMNKLKKMLNAYTKVKYNNVKRYILDRLRKDKNEGELLKFIEPLINTPQHIGFYNVVSIHGNM